MENIAIPSMCSTSFLISCNIAKSVDPVAIVSPIIKNGFSGNESTFRYDKSATH